MNSLKNELNRVIKIFLQNKTSIKTNAIKLELNFKDEKKFIKSNEAWFYLRGFTITNLNSFIAWNIAIKFLGDKYLLKLCHDCKCNEKKIINKLLIKALKDSKII